MIALASWLGAVPAARSADVPSSGASLLDTGQQQDGQKLIQLLQENRRRVKWPRSHTHKRDSQIPVSQIHSQFQFGIDWEVFMARFDLTDFEWSVIQPLLPNKPRSLMGERVVYSRRRNVTGSGGAPL